jgi:PIN domain nuclease of toxin-antitoxin system
LRLLLDTCAVIWWFADDPRLGANANQLIADADNSVVISVVSLWEVTIKHRLGRLNVRVGKLVAEIRRTGWHMLAITPDHLVALETLASHHRDPFDQLLIAQAIAEDLTIVTDDRHMRLYPVRHLSCAA